MANANLRALSNISALVNATSRIEEMRLVGIDNQGYRVIDGGDASAITAASLVELNIEDLGASVLVVRWTGSDRAIILGIIHEKPKDTSLSASVEGDIVRIRAERNLVLQCGKASVTLDANGAIKVKGEKITSAAKGRHNIRGGSVHLN